jgi:uncharacterized protein
MLLKLITLVLFSSPFIDLQKEKDTHAPKKASSNPLQMASLWLVALHQNHLTHMDGPRSHFYPCSSSYMKQALMKHGFFKGSLLGLNRLLHENSETWVFPKKRLEGDDVWIKLDPVP